jgi:hypothetical protein
MKSTKALPIHTRISHGCNISTQTIYLKESIQGCHREECNLSKKKAQLGQDELCKYRLSFDSNKITMIASCKECAGQADLKDRTCFSGILIGLCQEFNVDDIILSHYIESKYADDSMQMLRMMVEIVNELEHMGIRKPYAEYFESDSNLSSSQKNKQKDSCEKCELTPENIFTPLKKYFVKDLNVFYEEFNKLLGKIQDQSDEKCARCISETKSDLIYLFNKLENLRALVIYKGFQIVI